MNYEFQVYRAHRVAVTRLVVDTSGTYIMSAANDGKVIIRGILCEELNHVSIFENMLTTLLSRKNAELELNEKKSFVAMNWSMGAFSK